MKISKNKTPEYKYEVLAFYPNKNPVPLYVSIFNNNDFSEAILVKNEYQKKMKTEFIIAECGSLKNGVIYHKFPYDEVSINKQTQPQTTIEKTTT